MKKQKGLENAKKVKATERETPEVQATCVEGTLPEAIRVNDKYYFEGPAVIPEDEATAIQEAAAEMAEDEAEAGGGDEGGVTAREESKRGGRH